MSDVPEEIKVTGNEKWLRSFRYAPQGGTLTRVQLLIAQLVACGLSDKEISGLLGVASSTVKAHNGSILKCFGLWRRTQLVRFMLETGRFDPDGAERMLAERSSSPRRCQRATVEIED